MSSYENSQQASHAPIESPSAVHHDTLPEFGQPVFTAPGYLNPQTHVFSYPPPGAAPIGSSRVPGMLDRVPAEASFAGHRDGFVIDPEGAPFVRRVLGDITNVVHQRDRDLRSMQEAGTSAQHESASNRLAGRNYYRDEYRSFYMTDGRLVNYDSFVPLPDDVVDELIDNMLETLVSHDINGQFALRYIHDKESRVRVAVRYNSNWNLYLHEKVFMHLIMDMYEDLVGIHFGMLADAQPVTMPFMTEYIISRLLHMVARHTQKIGLIDGDGYIYYLEQSDFFALGDNPGLHQFFLASRNQSMRRFLQCPEMLDVMFMSLRVVLYDELVASYNFLAEHPGPSQQNVLPVPSVSGLSTDDAQGVPDTTMFPPGFIDSMDN